MSKSHMNSGIYQIVNRLNGKKYIGSARDFEKRKYGHENLLRRGMHVNKHLQASWNKYGANAFEFQVLLVCAPNNRKMYEQLALDNLMPEYNVCPSAIAPMTGRNHSPEACEKISAAHKGRKITWGLKISARKKGISPSASHREKIGYAMKGKPWTKARRMAQEAISNVKS